MTAIRVRRQRGPLCEPSLLGEGGEGGGVRCCSRATAPQGLLHPCSALEHFLGHQAQKGMDHGGHASSVGTQRRDRWVGHRCGVPLRCRGCSSLLWTFAWQRTVPLWWSVWRSISIGWWCLAARMCSWARPGRNMVDLLGVAAAGVTECIDSPRHRPRLSPADEMRVSATGKCIGAVGAGWRPGTDRQSELQVLQC